MKIERSWPGACVLLCTIFGLCLAPWDARAQFSTKSEPSPFAPGDLSKPVFDTKTRDYTPMPAQASAGSTVVAEVEGASISLADVREAIVALPGRYKNYDLDEVYPFVLEKLIKAKAVVVRARRQGVDEDPEYLRRVRALADVELVNHFMRREIAKQISESALLARYDRDFGGKPGPEEVSVRIIATETADQAWAALARLRNGEDFASLASLISKDPTARDGGQVGFAPAGNFMPEIAGAMSALAPGQIAPLPLRAAGLWYVVKLEERRNQPTPLFPVVRESILATMMAEAADQFAIAAMDGLTIRRFSFTGAGGQGAVEKKPGVDETKGKDGAR
jgi:peptidyl-prolyl cis-trans isomerase C